MSRATLSAAVVDALGERFGPEFRRHMQTARLWKNGNEGSSDDPVSDDDELAVIPRSRAAPYRRPAPVAWTGCCWPG